MLIADYLNNKLVEIVGTEYNGLRGIIIDVTDGARPFEVYLNDLGEIAFSASELKIIEEND